MEKNILKDSSRVSWILIGFLFTYPLSFSLLVPAYVYKPGAGCEVSESKATPSGLEGRGGLRAHVDQEDGSGHWQGQVQWKC